MTGKIDLVTGIDSLTNFKRNTAAFLERLRETGEPLVLTINGKAEVVVQDAGSFQRLLELLERFEAIHGVKNGLKEKEAGLGREAKKVIEAIRKKHRIPKK